MNLREIAKALDLVPITAEENLDREVSGCYAGDLLSCAMARAHAGYLWLTVQSHVNVVAVAVMLELAGVVVTEGAEADPATIERAAKEGVVVLSTAEATYSIAGKVWELGVRVDAEER